MNVWCSNTWIHAEDREWWNWGVDTTKNVHARPERDGTDEIHSICTQSGRWIGADVSIGETLYQEKVLRRSVVVKAVRTTNHSSPVSSRIECEAKTRCTVVP